MSSLQSMPPPQAPSSMGPPQSASNLQTQAMVMPQYSHNSINYTQGVPPSLMNGHSPSGIQQNQSFSGGPVNNITQPSNTVLIKYYSIYK